jgi:hypothetical protein
MTTVGCSRSSRTCVVDPRRRVVDSRRRVVASGFAWLNRKRRGRE